MSEAAPVSAGALGPSLEEPPLPGVDAKRLAMALGMTPTVAEWLLRLGFDGAEATQRFLQPRLSDLTPPDGMIDRAAAAERLARAIRSGERICVFGDYDCDGITSTAILTEVFRELGGDAVPLLASRFDGGYGVSLAAVERIAGTGATVLVTCDCGSSDHETLALLRTRGMDIVVIDHHLVPAEPLPALAFLNPHRPECGFPYKGLASCGLALSLAAALRSTLQKKLDLRRWLDLVAIGTVADVAPLDGDNRAMVRSGLALMRITPRPGIRALLELSKIDGLVPLRGEDVSYRLAPRINAPGRLGRPDLALELLLARSDEAARALAADIEQTSQRRKDAQQSMLAEAIAEIEQRGWKESSALVIGRQGWNHGIVGIVAGRLANRYERPVAVVGFDGALGRGSVRGPAGSQLHDALSRVADCLERFGGHQAAAGFEVRIDRLDELRRRFEDAIGALGSQSAPAPSDVIRLCPADEPARVVADLERLEPCGHKNPAPRIVLEGRAENARELRGGHLRADICLAGGRTVGAFAAGWGERSAALSGQVRLLGALRRDTFRGGNAVELFVEQLL